ncbi:MAG: GNAT family N-acetyltransferase [Planctomycetaceae bacterium]|nr:GNAT family N-acetyltransferase [Planctomycetales bacterium]MCB9872900.1 GNAT family N-acetyltransferase [Planctomycetaceae bacterium]MCB9941478.1 GNAT family N-acetyltransferase [Planctomycetaceae bacterium]
MNDLTTGDLAKWAELQRADRRYASAFLRPEFVQWLSELRDDIRVVVLKEGDSTVGFFPYEHSGFAGHSAGNPLSLCQAVVAEPDCRWNGIELLRAADLRRIVFDYWIENQSEIKPFRTVTAQCPFIDLSNGFEAYLAAKNANGSKPFYDISRKQRKLEREHGPVKCELISNADAVAELIKWKSAQCQRTHVADLFKFGWPAQLLTNAVTQGSEACGALLWGLRSNTKLIAINVLLRSHEHAHGWFMAFDRSYASYSPGMVLIHKMLHELASRGITRLDLGKGATGYKKRLMSDTTIVYEGIIDTDPAVRAVWQQWHQARNWLRESRLRPLAHRANRLVSNVRWLMGKHY